MKSLGVDKISEEFTPEEFANFDDTLAAKEPILYHESIFVMVREVEEPAEVESDEEDGDETQDKCLEKRTLIELRSAIETLLGFSLFM